MSAIATDLTPVVCPFCSYPLPGDLVIQEGARYTCPQCGQEISYEQLQAADLNRVAASPPYRYDEGLLDPSIDTQIEIVEPEVVIELPPTVGDVDVPDLESTDDPEEIDMDYGDPEFEEPVSEGPDVPIEEPEAPDPSTGEPPSEPVPPGGSDISGG